jgi:hypothetical protein
MKFAYADPPYLGCCRLYDHYHGDSGRCWDDIDTHRFLIDSLCNEFPDGWAMSLHSVSLRAILPLCPADVRVMAWVKPFAIFKPGVNPAYAWEPVIVRGGRLSAMTSGERRKIPTVRDWLAYNITLRRGLTGAKPEAFCRWLLDVLGARPEDDVVDLYPGTNALAQARNKIKEEMGT